MKGRKKRSIFQIVLLIIVLFAGCDSRMNKKLSVHENQEFKLVRFERELFSIDLYSIADSSRQFVNKYPEFIALFSSRIIEIGDTLAPFFGEKLTLFVTDKVIYELLKRTNEVFSDFGEQSELLARGLTNYKRHFPEKAIPTVYTYVSGLNQSIVTAENILGISLDKYLGYNEALYDKVYPAIPEYIRRNMQPEYIVPDAIRAWVTTDLEFKPKQDNFLSNILNEARGVFITKQLLPDVNDTLLWGFSSSQINFCKNNESEMWKYLIEQKLLFSTDNFRISKFIDPGPFTKEFTRESPPRAAVWIGYQIIDGFMSRHKNMTLSELAAINNFQVILNESRYNP
jgi:hypothetical protein